MKIAMSADCFYPAQMGGPSNAIYWQAKALTRAGHNVTIVATSHYLPPEIKLDSWLTLDCGQVIYTRNPHFYLPFKHIWFGWRAIRKADVVHVNSLFYPASLIWVLISRLANKPIIWSPHGELSPAALRFGSGLKGWFLKIARWLSPSIWFHATCATEAIDIQQNFGRSARVKEIGNRMELPSPTATTPNKRLYLLFIGRLHPIKAIDQLIEALGTSKVFRESVYSLRIAGPEDDKAYSQQLKEQVQTLKLSEKISFLGPVRGTDKERLYADAYVTVLPSHTENFGNVVIESLAQGTPVIASTGTPWQLLETERAGSWTDNNPDALRRAVEHFLAMPNAAYIAYRKRAIELARRDYDIMASVAVWTQFYKQALLTHGDNKQDLTHVYDQQSGHRFS